MGSHLARSTRTRDKRVYDIRAQADDETNSAWRLVSISADATIVGAQLTLLGAFEWPCDYGQEERGAARLIVDGRTFSNGKGSRTPVRRVLATGKRFLCESGTSRLTLECVVVAEYEVASRRHHPKVTDGAGMLRVEEGALPDYEFQASSATSFAQSAARGELRDAFVEPHPLEFIHGFLTAIVSGPVLMPRVWLGEFVFPIEDENSAAASLAEVMNLHNVIAQQLHKSPDEYIESTHAMLTADSNPKALVAWHDGYLKAIAYAYEQWEPLLSDPINRDLMTPFALVSDCTSDPTKRAWLDNHELRGNVARAMLIAALRIREFWFERLVPQQVAVRRAAPKIPPNAPCPCASGKKYKRCCGSVLRAVP